MIKLVDVLRVSLIVFLSMPLQGFSQDDDFSDSEALTTINKNESSLTGSSHINSDKANSAEFDPLMNSKRPIIPLSEEDPPDFSKRSPFSLSYFNWVTTNMKDYREGDNQFSSYNYVSFDYRINYESKFNFRPVFFINSAGDNFFGDYEKEKIEMGDVYFQYSHYNLALLMDSIGLYGATRLYLPTSASSKTNTMLARVQGRLIFSMPMGRGIELAYRFYPNYYFYSQRGTTNYFGAPKGNKQAELEQYLELNENLTSNFGFSQSVGMEHQWLYDVPSENKSSTRDAYLKVGLLANYNLSGVRFRFGLLNEIKVAEFKTEGQKSRKKPLKLYREEETVYSLMTYVRF